MVPVRHVLPSTGDGDLTQIGIAATDGKSRHQKAMTLLRSGDSDALEVTIDLQCGDLLRLIESLST
jgi:hypothetical protein